MGKSLQTLVTFFVEAPYTAEVSDTTKVEQKYKSSSPKKTFREY